VSRQITQEADVAGRDEFLRLIDLAYEHRRQGDKLGVARLCAVGATFRVAGDAPGMPSSSSPAVEAISKLIDAYTFHSVKRLDAIVEGDQAAVRLEVVVSPKGSAERTTTEILDVWTRDNDGRFTSLVQFIDTALAVRLAREAGL
jgi:hypothetical protein